MFFFNIGAALEIIMSLPTTDHSKQTELKVFFIGLKTFN